jgi:oligopeptide/dipeptide ABC transporter ATP-binding protein
VPDADAPLLELENVSIALRHGGRTMVTGVSLSLRAREVFGVVGESGSGKTLLARTIFGLHDDAYVSAGRVTFEGRELPLANYERAARGLLGHEVGFVPQDPFSSLNPSMRVGKQIAEALHLANGARMSAPETKKIAVGLMAEVGIPEPELAFNQYPDQFSGGMRQRIVFAIALSQRPKLLIADEPTTALDTITQRRIIELILERSRTHDLAVLLISHNLELLRQSVDRMAVLYGGQLMNIAESRDVGQRPLHPYTEALFGCIPSKGRSLADIHSIPGEPVGAGFGATGCAFASRCSHTLDKCSAEPALINAAVAPTFSACLLGRGA